MKSQPSNRDCASLLPGGRVGKAGFQRGSHGLRVGIACPTHRPVQQWLLACCALLLPCAEEAFALPPVQAQYQTVYFHDAGSAVDTHDAGTLGFLEQPFAHGRSSFVELLAQVPQQRGVVTNQQPKKEGEKRNDALAEQVGEQSKEVSHGQGKKSALDWDWWHIAFMGLMGFAMGGGFSRR